MLEPTPDLLIIAADLADLLQNDVAQPAGKENSKNQNTKLTRTNAKLEKQIETETAQTKKQKIHK